MKAVENGLNAGLLAAAPTRRREAAWAVSAQIVAMAISLAATIPLARLISPGEYGQFVWVLTAVSFVALVTDACTQSVLVRTPLIDEQDVGNLWMMAVVCGVLGASILFLLADPITSGLRFAHSELPGQLRLGAFTVVFMAAQHVPRGLLIRRGKLAAIAAMDLASISAASLVALALAITTHSAWALVMQLFLTAALRYVAYALASHLGPWMVRWEPKSVRALVRLIPGLWSYNLANFAARNFDNLIVGRLMGSESLGTYSRAFALLIVPLTQVQVGLGIYGLRLFSQYREDRVQLKHHYLRLLTLVEIVAFPFAVVFAVAAQPVVLVMFGSRWLGAVPLVRAFAIAGAVQAAASPASWLILALGRSRGLLWLGAANAAPLVAVAAGAIAHDFSLLSFGYGLIAGILVGAVGVYTAAATTVVRVRDVLLPASRRILAAALSAAPGVGALFISHGFSPLPRLIMSAMAIVLFYIALLRVLDPPAFRLAAALSRQASSAGWDAVRSAWLR